VSAEQISTEVVFASIFVSIDNHDGDGNRSNSDGSMMIFCNTRLAQALEARCALISTSTCYSLAILDCTIYEKMAKKQTRDEEEPL
jgi:hypothetical protein